MTVYYRCDLCKNEMAAQDQQPEVKALVQTKDGEHEVGLRIIRSVNRLWNGGDICGNCMAQALRNMAIQMEQS